jgi:hypothetical protein
VEPASPRDELDEVLNALLPFAQEMLQKHGEFYPFAAAMTRECELASVAGDVGSEQPDPRELADFLFDALREMAQRGEIKASGVCVNVTVSGEAGGGVGDAIGVFLEHAEDEPVEVFLPYARRRLRGYTFEELFANPGHRRVFEAASNAGE